MDIELTKDAKQGLATIYKSYKARRDNGVAKSQAVIFEDSEIPSAIRSSIQELRKAKLVNENIIGDVTLEDKAIIYLENKPMEDFKTFLSFALQLIP